MEVDLDPNPLRSNTMVEFDRLAKAAAGRPAVDVGANIGGYVETLLANGLSPIHAFEPVPGPFEAMAKRFASNPSVIMNNVGLWDSRERFDHCKIYNVWTISNRLVDENTVPGRNFRTPEFSMVTTTLDIYFGENNITDLGFIKIDVDGGELRVLKGATSVLSKFKPPILFEVSGLGERYFGDSRMELATLIVDLGYMAVSMDGGYTIRCPKALARHMPFHTTFDIMLVPK